MVSYAFTIFLSAFLLFQVQPLVGKKILPWFGGTPAVWTTCMLFFQIVLLAGYAYAHFVVKRLSPRGQMILHFGLLAATLVFLPIGPTNNWKPTGEEVPTERILLTLAANIGLPYFLLSSTGPLLQGWFARANPQASPYRLYALSNAGSLLALVSYPFLFEPNLTWGQQSWCWSIAYGVFVVGCGWCAWRMVMHSASDPDGTAADEMIPAGSVPVKSVAEQGSPIAPSSIAPPPLPIEPPGVLRILLWLVLAALGSVMLLATTNMMCLEIPTVPLLWILPLALYLLTFIIAFENERWYVRPVAGLLLIGFGAWAMVVMANGATERIWLQVPAYAGAAFASCFVCHGELARSKPHPRYLTLFYLMLSLGGALGGVLVAVVCPLVFNGFWELPLGLGAVLCMFAFLTIKNLPLGAPGLQRLSAGFVTLGLAIAVAAGVIYQAKLTNIATIYVSRNFFGTLRIFQKDDEEDWGVYRQLLNGNIDHGYQLLDYEKREWHTSYYAERSGVGQAIVKHPKRLAGRGMTIGVIGLGTGTLASFGEPRDKVRFYEINPAVVDIAQKQKLFTYLEDCPSDKAIVLGDARVSLEREADRGEFQQFDVLAIDAFSSDSIPLHLLKKECMEIYLKHMAPGGVIAFHISNRHLNLSPVVRGLADEFHLYARRIENLKDHASATATSDWILVSDDRALLDAAAARDSKAWPEKGPERLLWTDDFGSLWQVLEWE